MSIQHQAVSLEPMMLVPTPANPQQGDSDEVSSAMEGKVNSLKEMFPVISTERITQALHEKNGDVQKVINILLGDIDAGLIRWSEMSHQH